MTRKRNPEVQRRGMLKHKYGISASEYEQMFMDQGGVCVICRQSAPDGQSLCVDHCHKTDGIRGLLCMKCNAALGLLMDDPDLMYRAAVYVESYQEEQK